MSKKIVKKIRASVGYLSDLKATSPLEIQKVVDFLFDAAFFDRNDNYFTKIVKAEVCKEENYQWFDGKRYIRREDGHYYGSYGKLLHRDVWEHFNGEIPKGYVIHHVDGDPSNNDISNLQIMTISEHTKFHRQSSETKKYTCDYCGKEFYGKNATRGTHRFCSKECNSKWAYKNRNETRICAECGKEFTTNKYRKTKYCSKECVAKVNSRVHKKNKH